MTVTLIVLAALLLAYANGANDNFKGVATLFGSGTTDYRRALAWATVTTLLGSLTAVVLAQTLLKSFSGRGLVDAALVTDPRFVASVGLGAAATVLLATRIGMPISTTHGLVGALVGAGLAAGSHIDTARLTADFFAPLLLSPVLAIGLTMAVYLTLSRLRRAVGIERQTCLCAGREVLEVVTVGGLAAASVRAQQLTISTGTTVSCQARYDGKLVGVDAGTALNFGHFLSAGVVSFARGLNDTPKIAALLLLAPGLGSWGGVALVGVLIAIGGMLNARRIANVMGRGITPMNHGQGFTANLITGLIVIGASRFGWPVSTTHVSCGALFGIGAITREARWATIGKIVTAWVTTLPTAGLLGAGTYWLVAHLA